MKLDDLTSVIGALEEAGARYLVVGGVAVNAHGHMRATRDLDLVIQLERRNIERAVAALRGLGYRPMVPVDIDDLADAELRRVWREERNMEVFSLVSDEHRQTPVDVFVSEPFDFDGAYRHSLEGELEAGVKMRFVALGTLIAMKEATGRARDRADAAELRAIREQQGGAP